MSFDRLHPHRFIKSKQIEIVPRHNMAYTISDYAEDNDIRYGFGVCGKLERSHIKVVEIHYYWLGVVFHIIATSECASGIAQRVQIVKDDIGAVKNVAREAALAHIQQHPEQLEIILTMIHEASREQGQLEVINNAINQFGRQINWG